METRVYSAQRTLANPAGFVTDMLRDLVNGRELAWRLFLRDLKAQFRQSYLGYAWLFLPAIVSTVIWFFLNDRGVLAIADTGVPYPVFVLSGLLLWEAFVGALNAPINGVSQSASMLVKVNFPRESLLLAAMLRVLFEVCVRFLILVPVLIWYDIAVTSSLLLAPFLVFGLIALGFTMGTLLTPLGILYHDVGRLISTIATLWFFLTPVVYPPPQEWPASVVVDWNPVSPFLISARQALLGQSFTHFDQVLWIGLATTFAGLLAWVLYRLAMPHLISRMGN